MKAPSRFTARAATRSHTGLGSWRQVVTVERAIVSDIESTLHERVTGQMTFDSHLLNLVDVASRLVNGLTPGLDGGHESPCPAARSGNGPSPRRSAATGGVRRR